MRKKISILLVLLLVLGWYETVQGVFGKSAEAQKHVAAAEEYERKEIYEDALTEYEAAASLMPQASEISHKIAEMHLLLGDKTKFVTTCEALIYQQNMDETALEMLVGYYCENGKKKDAVLLLKELKNNGKENERVNALWRQYRGYYEELYFYCEEMFPYYGQYAVVGNHGSYGIADTDGNIVLPVVNEKAGYFCEDEPQVAAVVQNGNSFYINQKGNKKIVPDEKYDELGILSENRSVAKKGEKKCYVDRTMKALTEPEWEDATAFREGIAAVRKNGKWALIKDDFTMLTEYIFDDVAVDEMGFCSRGKRIFAKTADGWKLLNEKGETVAEQFFDDVRPFEEDVTAVCIGGKWGYVNTDGEWLIEAAYEDAYPFAHGLAPVRYDGKWGYIDLQGEIVVEAEFEAACPFNEDGTAPVKRGDDWTLIRLYSIV